MYEPVQSQDLYHIKIVGNMFQALLNHLYSYYKKKEKEKKAPLISVPLGHIYQDNDIALPQ